MRVGGEAGAGQHGGFWCYWKMLAAMQILCFVSGSGRIFLLILIFCGTLPTSLIPQLVFSRCYLGESQRNTQICFVFLPFPSAEWLLMFRRESRCGFGVRAVFVCAVAFSSCLAA